MEALESRLMLSAVAIDGFESGDFDGGSGQWAGDGGWIASGDASVGTDGPHSGSYHARLRRSSGDLQRTVDVSGLTDVTLQFSARLNSFEGSDQAHVRVSADGVNWTTLQTFVDGQDDDLYHDYSLSVPDLGDTLYVRFDAAMDAPNDFWYLDDITVIGTSEPAGPPQITISNAALNEDGNTSTFIGTGVGGLQHPSSLLRGPDGLLYVGDGAESDSVLRYDLATGEFVDVFVASGSGGLDNPHGMAFGPDGNFYVASGFDSRVLRYDGTTGAFLDEFIPAGSGGLDKPRSLIFHTDGLLYVGSGFSDEVLRYDAITGAFLIRFRMVGVHA